MASAPRGPTCGSGQDAARAEQLEGLDLDGLGGTVEVLGEDHVGELAAARMAVRGGEGTQRCEAAAGVGKVRIVARSERGVRWLAGRCWGVREEDRGREVVEGGVRVAVHHGALEPKDLGRDLSRMSAPAAQSKGKRGSMSPYQLKLLHQFVERLGDGADQGMLTTDQAQQLGQLQVAETMDLLQQIFICHGHSGGRLPTPWRPVKPARR
jgi:hypothetical protein